jgi:hypothetical protein
MVLTPPTAATVPDDSSAAALMPVPQMWLASCTAVTSLGKLYEKLTLHWQGAANEMRLTLCSAYWEHRESVHV